MPPVSTPWRSAQDILHNAFDEGTLALRLAPYSGAIAAAAVTVGTSAVALPATPLAGRRVLLVRSPVDIYIGASGVTTANGFLVAANTTITLEVSEEIVVYGVCGTAGNSVRVLEIS